LPILHSSQSGNNVRLRLPLLFFFLTYFWMKDALTLIRVRLVLLLSSGFVNFMFLLIISSLMIYFRGTNHFIDQLTVDLNKKTDIAWVSVLVLSMASLFLTLLAGTFAVCFFQNFERLSSTLSPFSTYVSFSPESPYSDHWKPLRRTPNRGDFPRSSFRDLYPHRALISACQSPKKETPGQRAIIQELKTTLPNRNEQPLTVL